MDPSLTDQEESKDASQDDIQESKNEKILVAVRCRPLVDKERAEGATKVVTIIKDTSSIAIDDPRDERKHKQYIFDDVFDEESEAADVFTAVVRPVAHKFTNGYNGTVFAYGQTGSGKTFTIKEIMPLISNYLFT